MFRILLFLLFLVSVVAGQVQAAPQTDQLEILRARLQSDRVTAISDAMQLTEQGSAVFWPLYRKYESEVAIMGDQRVSLFNEYAQAFNTMDNSTAQNLLTRSMAWREKRARLLHDFVRSLETKMSPVVAARFYQVERYLTLMIDLNVANQIPLIQYGSGKADVTQ